MGRGDELEREAAYLIAARVSCAAARRQDAGERVDGRRDGDDTIESQREIQKQSGGVTPRGGTQVQCIQLEIMDGDARAVPSRLSA